MRYSALSRLSQLIDTAFPSGAFANSFGLETHFLCKKIDCAAKLKIFIENIIIDEYKNRIFPLINDIFQAAEIGNSSRIITADRRYFASLNFAFAKAAKMIGENYSRYIFNFQISKKAAIEYFAAIKNGGAPGTEICVLSSYAFEIGADKNIFSAMWAKKQLCSIASCALKLSAVKPAEIQNILFSIDDLLESAVISPQKYPRSFNPLFDLILYRRSRVDPRLFRT